MSVDKEMGIQNVFKLVIGNIESDAWRVEIEAITNQIGGFEELRGIE